MGYLATYRYSENAATDTAAKNRLLNQYKTQQDMQKAQGWANMGMSLLTWATNAIGSGKNKKDEEDMSVETINKENDNFNKNLEAIGKFNTAHTVFNAEQTAENAQAMINAYNEISGDKSSFKVALQSCVDYKQDAFSGLELPDGIMTKSAT